MGRLFSAPELHPNPLLTTWNVTRGIERLHFFNDLCVCECTWAQMPAEAELSDLSGTGVTGSCELADAGVLPQQSNPILQCLCWVPPGLGPVSGNTMRKTQSVCALVENTLPGSAWMKSNVSSQSYTGNSHLVPYLAIVNSQEKIHRTENSQAETEKKKNYQEVYIKNRRNFIFIKFKTDSVMCTSNPSFLRGWVSSITWG